eukprot:193316-Chlamydomonas_euryale.AAC.1
MAHCGSSSGNLAQGGRQIGGSEVGRVLAAVPGARRHTRHTTQTSQQHASIELDQWAQTSHRLGSRTTVKAWRQHVHNAAI